MFYKRLVCISKKYGTNIMTFDVNSHRFFKIGFHSHNQHNSIICLFFAGLKPS